MLVVVFARDCVADTIITGGTETSTATFSSSVSILGRGRFLSTSGFEFPSDTFGYVDGSSVSHIRGNVNAMLTAVPEPSSLTGLGLVACGGLVVHRPRRQ